MHFTSVRIKLTTFKQNIFDNLILCNAMYKILGYTIFHTISHAPLYPHICFNLTILDMLLQT